MDRGPLLTSSVVDQLRQARRCGLTSVECTLDLKLSSTDVALGEDAWTWQGQPFPYLEGCKPRTIYHWAETGFEPIARYAASLIKLVPTDWGPPTFEIDGIKMLPTAQVSPFEDAQRKVRLIRPRGKVILDTCGGLGYFAAWCLRGGAANIVSFEKNPDVLWLRTLNPWSPADTDALDLTQADATEAIRTLATGSIDAVLHDPPRFGIAGELYSQSFYDGLSRVMKRRGRLFHYTGTPNKLKGRDLATEVAQRLRMAGFDPERNGDGVLAVKK